jgi:hypothetical protein
MENYETNPFRSSLPSLPSVQPENGPKSGQSDWIRPLKRFVRNEAMRSARGKGEGVIGRKGGKNVNSLLHGNLPNEPISIFVSFVSLWFTIRICETNPFHESLNE